MARLTFGSIFALKARVRKARSKFLAIGMLSQQLLVSHLLSNQIMQPAHAAGETLGRPGQLSTNQQSFNNAQGSTRVLDFGRSRGVINIADAFQNSGVLYLVSSNPAIRSGILNAKSFYNYPGALISSVIPAGGLPGYDFLVPNFSFSLNSRGNFINQGTITSAGSLSINAAQISNLTAPGSAAATISALANLDLFSTAGSIVNRGDLLSVNGNVNLTAQSGKDLIVDNSSGSIQALLGAVNAGDALSSVKQNLAIIGGNIFSETTNLYAACGKAVASVDKLSGVLNIYAAESHTEASSSGLKLGKIVVSGDPTFYAQTDLYLDSDLVFSGAPLAIVTGGSILTKAGAGKIETHGGDITLMAGVDFSSSSTVASDPFAPVTLTISGASPTGGKIDLASVTSINSGGGNILMIASNGIVADSGSIRVIDAPIVSNGGRVLIVPGSLVKLINVDSSKAGKIGGAIKVYADSTSCTGCIVKNGVLSSDTFLPPEFTTSGKGQPSPNMAGLITGDFISGGGDILLQATKLSAREINASSTTGAGGNVEIFSGQPGKTPLTLSASTGDIGTITAHGTSGGGTISVRTGGHLELLSDAVLDVGASNGSAGSISLRSGFNAEYETIFNGTELEAKGSGSKGNGGAINIETARLTSNNHLVIDVSGSGTGNGGSVTLGGGPMTGSGVLTSIGKGIGEIEINAQSGSAGGNGGSATLNADPIEPLIIDPSALKLNPQGINGNGGMLAARGDINVTSSLLLNGVGTGNGGKAILFGAFGTDINVGNGIKGSGINGIIQANSGVQGGSGGQIEIDASNVHIENANSISLHSAAGNGGNLSLSTGGVLTLGTSSFNVDGTGKSGNGGTIAISADSLVLPPGESLKLSAVGSGSGNGGKINVGVYSQDLSTGKNAGQIDAQAFSGPLGGNGGSLAIAGKTVNANTADFDISPKGKSGNGGNLQFSSDFSTIVDGNINLNAIGNGNGGSVAFFADTLFVNGSIQANGAGKGNGGTVAFFVNQDLTLDSGIKSNGITGTINAYAGSSGGKGGQISFLQLQNLTISNPQSISVASKNGSGGSLYFTARKLNLGEGIYNVSGTGAHGNGGEILLAGDLTSTGHITLKSNASGDGTGGGISVYGDYFFGASTPIHIGNGKGQVSVEANGGSKGSLKGDAGNLTLSGIVLDDVNAVNAVPLGVNGKGARLALSNFPSFNGNLDANGKGTGNGGTIIIQSTSAKSIGPGGDINGTLSVNSDSGKAGSISISFSDITILPDAFSVRSKTGAGGSIQLDLSNLTLADGSALVANAGKGNGGEIKIFSPTINTLGKALLSADGASNGNGGSISLITNSNLQIDDSLLSAHANSGSAGGNGGLIELSANDLTINPSALKVDPLGKTGNGGTLLLTAKGTLKVLGDIAVDGKGNGNGGTLIFDWAHGADTFVVGGTSSASGVTGKISANGSGTGIGGTIAFANAQDILPSTIIINSEVSTLPNSATYGKVLLLQDRFLTSIFTLGGSGVIKGSIGTGYLNPLSEGSVTGLTVAMTTPVDIGHLSTKDDVTITAPSIHLFTGSFITSKNGNVNLNSNSILNDGLIASASAGVNIQATADLSVTGQGTIIAKTPINFSSPGAVFVRQFLPGNNYNSSAPFDIQQNTSVTTSALFELSSKNSTSPQSIKASLDSVSLVFPSLQLPSSSSVVSTDSVPRHISLDSGDSESDGIVKIGNGKFVVVNNIQSLSAFVASDNSLEFAEEGSEITKEEETIYLHKGKMVINTSNKAESVITPQGTVRVEPNSTTMVKVSSSGTLSAVSLNGSTALQQGQRSDSVTKIEKGQELLSNQNGLEDEELIPVDGIDCGEVISAGLTKAGGRTTVKRTVSIKQMVDKDIMINGSLIHVHGATAKQHKTYVENLKSSLNEAPSQHKPIAYVQPIVVPNPTAASSFKTNRTKVQGPILLGSKDAKFQQLQNSYIKLESGNLFVHAKQDTIISTKFCVVKIGAGSCANISTDNQDKTIIRVCTGINSVRVFVRNKHDAALSAGEELVISKRTLKDADVNTGEQIGHRNSKMMHCLGLNFAHSEFSIPALFISYSHLRPIMKAQNNQYTSTKNQVMKSAVIVQMVQGKHGRYTVK